MEVRSGYKQTEVGVIPKEWDVPFLRQYLLQDATYGVVKAGTFQRTGIPMLRGGDIKNGSITEDQPLITVEKSQEYSRTVLKEKDVVIALVGYPGETAVIPNRLVGANISRAVGLLRPTRTLRPEFLACYLNSPNGRKEFLRPSAGSAQIVVNLGALNRLRLPLPPLPEQRAIAAALSDVDALLGGLDRLIAKKRDLKQAAMQQLLTGQTRLPGFRGEWEVKRLGDLFEITSSKRVFQSEWKSEGIPFYRARELAVLGETGRVDNELFITKSLYDSFKTAHGVPEVGDMLVTGVGTLGKVYVVRDEEEFYFKDGNIIWFKIHGAVSAEFLRQLYLTKVLMKQITDGSAGTTVGTYTISGAKKTEIPFPPLPEQAAIAAVLSDMAAELAALEARRNKTRALKQAMMQELLTGKTRLVTVGGADA